MARVDRERVARDRLRAAPRSSPGSSGCSTRCRRADRRMARRARRRRPSLAVVEVPLLFETGMEDAFDATIAVVADDAVRAERAGRARHASARGPQGRQLSQEEKARRATYVVTNDGTLASSRRSSSCDAARPGAESIPSCIAAPEGRIEARARRRRRRSLVIVVGCRRGADRGQQDRRREAIRERHAAAPARGHHPPAGRPIRARPGADRRGDLPESRFRDRSRAPAPSG